jgi:hypothetical protein
MEKPKLRPLQVGVFDGGVILIDPLRITPEPIMVSSGAALLLSLMDGSRDIFEIANEYKNITWIRDKVQLRFWLLLKS